MRGAGLSVVTTNRLAAPCTSVRSGSRAAGAAQQLSCLRRLGMVCLRGDTATFAPPDRHGPYAQGLNQS